MPDLFATKYWVSPEDDGWTVAREEQILARYPDRPQATVAAVALARIDRPATLIILDDDGAVVEERAFERDISPSPSASTGGRSVVAPVEVERLVDTEGSPHEVTLRVRGDLAHEPWLVQLSRTIMDELDDPQLYTMIVDMAGVTDFDVACIANWVGLEHFVREQGRTLRIRNASPVVHAVLQRMTTGR